MLATSRVPRVAAAFGGGGPVGIGFNRGVADALIAAGVPLTGAAMIGASAGAFVAASLSVGLTWSDLAAASLPRVPNLRPDALAAIAGELFGDRPAPGVQVNAVQLPTLRRVGFDAGQRAVAPLLAASAAVPGLFAPAWVDHGCYIDGGLVSLVTPTDFTDADHLIVVAPLAGALLGAVGRFGRWTLNQDIARWRQANPAGQVTLITPDHRVAAIAPHPLALFNRTAAEAAYDLGVQHAQEALTAGTAMPAAR